LSSTQFSCYLPPVSEVESRRPLRREKFLLHDAKNPAFTVVALAALMLGIGASTAVFSVVESVLLRPLPYSDPDRLVWVHDGLTQGDKSGWSACMEDFLLWQVRARSFAQLAAFTGTILP